MGTFERTFSDRLQELVQVGGWGATFASGLQRRVYSGAARLREWMQPDVWAQLEAPPGRFAEEHGFEFHGRHHEIYIGDPTRSKSENLRTVLRHPVKT
jgi:hypothetical protein